LADVADQRRAPEAPALGAALRDSLERALEGLLSERLADECAPNEASSFAGPRFVARIVLRGEGEAHFRVSCTEVAVQRIATTLLCAASPDELAAEEVLDALGEFANVVAGGVKTTVFDGRGAWQLGTPTCAVEESTASEAETAALACRFGGGLLAVGLDMRAPLARAA
jgi:CheY-specific phosphatase CheX